MTMGNAINTSRVNQQALYSNRNIVSVNSARKSDNLR